MQLVCCFGNKVIILDNTKIKNKLITWLRTIIYILTQLYFK